MAVTSETLSTSYAADGVTVTFAIPFYFLDNSHVDFYHTPTGGSEVSYTASKTISGAGNEAGGSVTFDTAPASGTLRIVRDVPITQTATYNDGDSFPASSHEKALDKLTMIAQELRSGVSANAQRSITNSGLLEDFSDQVDIATSAAASAQAASVAAEEAQSQTETALAAAVAISNPYVSVTRGTIRGLTPTDGLLVNLNDGKKGGEFVGFVDDISDHMAVETQVSTSINTATDTITRAYHQLALGEAIYLPVATADLASFTKYFVMPQSSGSFKLASSWANARAGVAINLTSAANFTYIRHADPHEAVYIIPTALKCDGSEGGFKRRMDDAGDYHTDWLPLDEGFAANQGIASTLFYAMKDGGAFFQDPVDTFYPVTGYINARFRHCRKIHGVGDASWFHGNGLAGSVYRVMRGSCEICFVKGGNFSGQVDGGLTANDANLSESCFIHAFPLDQGMELEDVGGDYLDFLHIHDITCYDVDSGVSVSANHHQNTSGALGWSDLQYFSWSNVWVSDVWMWGIARQGIELFLTEFSFINNAHIEMGEKGEGFSTLRGLRLVGALNTLIANSFIIGDDETVPATRAVAVEVASMSLVDDPVAVRHSGKVICCSVYSANFAEHYTLNSGIGAVKLNGCVATGDPSKRTAEKSATISIADPAVITLTNHLLIDGAQVYFSATTGSLPTGVALDTFYYAKVIDKNTFNLTDNKGGSILLATSGGQSGTHTLVIPRCSEANTFMIRAIASGWGESFADSDVTISIASPCVVTWPSATNSRVRIDDPVTLYTNGALPTGVSHGEQFFARPIGGAATIALGTPGVFTRIGHGMADNTPIKIETTGVLPTGSGVGRLYYTRNSTSDTFEISATSGGASIALSGAQSGTHTVYLAEKFNLALRPGGAAIDTSGAQSGTHRAVLNRYDKAKNEIAHLTVDNCDAYLIAVFFRPEGAFRYSGGKNNRHIGNANSTSKFIDHTNATYIHDKERHWMAEWDFNTSITNKLAPAGSISINNTFPGENYFFAGNRMSGGSADLLISEGGVSKLGKIRPKSPMSNILLDPDIWKERYNPPPEFGPLDHGSYVE